MIDYLSQLIDKTVIRGALTILLVIILTLVLLYLVRLASKSIEKRIETTRDPDRRARLHTLRKAIISTVQAIILTIAVLISLGTIGVDIGPALTAAGILGLAVSLGAQTLIKDVIGGLTILLEDEYRVGDQVKIGLIIGEVEAISLRRTDLRDAEGRLYMVPNGDVRIVANETREWARALVEFSFKANDDLEKATAALEKSLARLSADQNIKPFLLGEPEIFGWNDIKDWSVVMRLRAKVVAGKHDEVSRYMRQYAFEELHAAHLLENNL